MKTVDMTLLDGLVGRVWPSVSLPATDGSIVSLAQEAGGLVLFAYPRTSPADGSSIPEWDNIPGAKGCIAQSCGFRDEYQTLQELGIAKVYGLSTQDTEFEKEAIARLRLPFPLLSDEDLALQRAMGLPYFEAADMTLLHRFAMDLHDAEISQVFHSLEDTGAYATSVIVHLRGA